jgi:transcriptional regulator with XRE-family HTH domain
MSEPQTVAFRKLDEILAFGWDAYTVNFADQLRMAMKLMPMRLVLDKVPGETIRERAKAVGISRNTWYCWYRGEVRPNKRQAERIAKLTGIKPDRFQGRR